MGDRSNKLCSVTLEFQINTDEATGFYMPDTTDIVWIPHSQFENYEDYFPEDEGDHFDVKPSYHAMLEIHIPIWLAEKKSLESYCEEMEDEAR